MKRGFFQEIYDEVIPYVPDGFDKLIIYLEYGKNSYSFAFYAKINGKYVKCYDWPGFGEDVSWNVFKKIDEIASEERKETIGELWSNMTMTIGQDGSFHTDYDYTDLTDCAYAYKKEWKKKYLM